ncbi:MAG: heat-inducible transcriptional repressor HrcA [Gammaproteobacteria bacterium]|nr:heat-inducible transcriptional repressor HrcA [Gammaproteobacteria bacterium]
MARKRQEPTQGPDGQLSERAQHLMKALVERYIRDGEPVGSRNLARDSALDLSPATIRNIMADLEELGMVRSPHTSAGRVPTAKGYRLFVDALLTVKPLSASEMFKLQNHMRDEGMDSQALVESTSKMLSSFTHMAGLVTVPKSNRSAWRHIEFLPLSDRRVLAILVMNEQEVQNRIIQLDRDYSQAELIEAANYLNSEFSGRDVSSIREHILREMGRAREHMNQQMSSAIQLAEKMVKSPVDRESGYVLAGETNLMEFAELSNVDKLRQLFEAFNTKRDLLHLLDQCVSADGVQIFIGEESGYEPLDDMSLVSAPYSVNDDQVGVLAVIGPSRMAYERVIPIVDVTSKLLTAALNPKKS